MEENQEVLEQTMCSLSQPSDEAPLIVPYSIFIATVYMTKPERLKVTNRDVHQVE